MGLVDVDRVTGKHELLGFSRPELPRMPEVLHAAHAEAGTDDVGEPYVITTDNEVARPHQHQPCREHFAVDLGDGYLAQVAPSQCVLEEVVPLLQHDLFGALSATTIDRRRRVLIAARHVFLYRLLGPDVVTG